MEGGAGSCWSRWSIDGRELELGGCRADGQRAVGNVSAVDEQMRVGSLHEDGYGVPGIRGQRRGRTQRVRTPGPEEWLAITQAEEAREGLERAADAGKKRGLVGPVGLDPECERPSRAGERERVVRGHLFRDTNAAGDGVHIEWTVGRRSRDGLGARRAGEGCGQPSGEQQAGEDGAEAAGGNFQLHRVVTRALS